MYVKIFLIKVEIKKMATIMTRPKVREIKKVLALILLAEYQDNDYNNGTNQYSYFYITCNVIICTMFKVSCTHCL